MSTIVASESLAPGIHRHVVEAPAVARRARPGQFVIVRVVPGGERIPLTIVAVDPGAGRLTLVVQSAGRTTSLLNRLDGGDRLADLVGPLGCPTEVERFGTVAVVGGGVGAAIALPVAAAMSVAGNRVIAITGARTAELLILVDELEAASDGVLVCTDDGSAGRHGLVTHALTDLLTSERVDRVFAAGPIVMMEAVAETTREPGISTVVSLNPIMVDGTGMCGGCRVRVDGEARFACVEGPEFDAHRVDFATLRLRNRAYLEFERERTSDLEGLDPPEVDRLLAPTRSGACKEGRE